MEQLLARMLQGGGGRQGGAPSGDAPGAMPDFAAMLRDAMQEALQEQAGAGVAADSGPGGGAGSAHAAGLDLAALLGQAGLAAPGVGGPGGAAAPAGVAGAASGPGHGPDDDGDAFSSSALRGLAAQTQKTVSRQKKQTRGHVELPQRPGAGGASTSGAGGGGGLGDLLGALGAMGAAGGGAEGGAAPGMDMMVDYIMQNLLSKDVLYGPLKVGPKGGARRLLHGLDFEDRPLPALQRVLHAALNRAQCACSLMCTDAAELVEVITCGQAGSL